MTRLLNNLLKGAGSVLILKPAAKHRDFSKYTQEAAYKSLETDRENLRNDYVTVRDKYYSPPDWENPDWSDEHAVHNWRNYISEEMQEIWQTFTPEQKRLIAGNANEMASNEEWD